MKKKICFFLFTILLTTTLAYASQMALIPPHVQKNKSSSESREKQAIRRGNYKPWSGARPDTNMKNYGHLSTIEYLKVGLEFELSYKQYEDALKASDKAARSFDKVATNY